MRDLVHISAAPRAEAGSLRHLASAPFIYAMIVPLVLLDAGVSLYQAICFRLWRIERSRRGEHVRIDRYKLSYLTALQKLNCVYCSYANGVLAFAADIAARTEQYWCPIQHERAPRAPHRRYASFVPFGERRAIAARIEALRESLRPDAREEYQSAR
jgi:hypothetical protein